VNANVTSKPLTITVDDTIIAAQAIEAPVDTRALELKVESEDGPEDADVTARLPRRAEQQRGADDQNEEG
jgi:hypothetical protein